MQKKKKFQVENKDRKGKTWNIEYKIKFFKPINCHEVHYMLYSSNNTVLHTEGSSLPPQMLTNRQYLELVHFP